MLRRTKAPNYLVDRGTARRPSTATSCSAHSGPFSATAAHLAAVSAALPQSTWHGDRPVCTCEMNALAITMGGHVRVGLEDDAWYDDDRTQRPPTPA